MSHIYSVDLHHLRMYRGYHLLPLGLQALYQWILQSATPAIISSSIKDHIISNIVSLSCQKHKPLIRTLSLKKTVIPKEGWITVRTTMAVVAVNIV